MGMGMERAALVLIAACLPSRGPVNLGGRR